MAAVGCIYNMEVTRVSTLYGSSCRKKSYFIVNSPQGDGESGGKRMMVSIIRRGTQNSQVVRVTRHLTFRKHISEKRSLENKKAIHYKAKSLTNEEEKKRPSWIKKTSSNLYFQAAAFNNRLLESLAIPKVRKAVQTLSRNCNVKIFTTGNRFAINPFPIEISRYFTSFQNYHNIKPMATRNISQDTNHCSDNIHFNTEGQNTIQANDGKDDNAGLFDNVLKLDCYADKKSSYESSLNVQSCPRPNEYQEEREIRSKLSWGGVLNLCGSAVTVAGIGLLIYRFSK